MANSFPGSGLAYADCFSVGTSSPSQIFEVKSPSNDGACKKYVFKGYDSTGNQNGIALRVFDTQTAVGFADVGADYYGGGGNTNLTFSTRNAGAALEERMRLTSCGAMYMSRVASDITFGDNVGGMYVRQNGNGAGTQEELRIFGRNISFVSHAGTRYMDVTSTGNIGIGTSTPAFKLHICSNVQQDGLVVENQCRNISCFKSTSEHTFMYIDSAHQCIYQPAIFFMRAGNLFSELRLQRASSSDPLGNYVESEGLIGSTGNTPFSIQSCGTRRIHLSTNGNVGINCTTPSYRLHVNGTFYAAGSSQEYKTSICQYDTNSCMFMKLKPVTYQYKDEYKHLGKELKSETQIGLIAEEVAETYPELAILVKENDNDVVRNVDYEKLSIVLLAEVQKLRKEVDDLKTK
jgi:hypothetical protein